MELGNEFQDLWNNEVKPQIEKCAPEYDKLCLLFDETRTSSQQEELVNTLKGTKYLDLRVQFLLGNFVERVEDALENDHCIPAFQLSLHGLRSYLDGDYWKRAFNEDFSSDEAKELRKISELLGDLSRSTVSSRITPPL